MNCVILGKSLQCLSLILLSCDGGYRLWRGSSVPGTVLSSGGDFSTTNSSNGRGADHRPHQEEKLFSLVLASGLAWLIGCGRGNTVPAPTLGLKRLVSSTVSHPFAVLGHTPTALLEREAQAAPRWGATHLRKVSWVTQPHMNCSSQHHPDKTIVPMDPCPYCWIVSMLP